MQRRIPILLLLLPFSLSSQAIGTDRSDEVLKEVISRLEKVETQNRELMEEIKSLREKVAASEAAAVAPPDPPSPTLDQRLDVAERRIDEQAQTKVEASQKFPVRITGALLFNAFSNAGSYYPIGMSPLLSGPEQSGATVRQTLLGLDFNGPNLPWNGKASGSLTLDFAGSTLSSYGATLNIRRAALNLDWAKRTIELGQDKPLISRRAPDSLAEVLVPPLSYSGNPWVWVPQVRYVEHIGNRERYGIDVESSVLETEEELAYQPTHTDVPFQKARPAFEARVGFYYHDGPDRRFEFAPGFHTSTSHINGSSVPSDFATLDWLIRPSRFVQFTGFFAAGKNMANLGGFSDGFYLDPNYVWRAVRGAGGWTQVAVQLTPRLTWNSFAGLQAPHTYELANRALSHDYSFATNVIYRIAPNILVGAEALQERSGYVGQSHLIRDHYDLAIGYLF